jgi:hypothetical protein
LVPDKITDEEKKIFFLILRIKICSYIDTSDKIIILLNSYNGCALCGMKTERYCVQRVLEARGTHFIFLSAGPLGDKLCDNKSIHTLEGFALYLMYGGSY